MTFFWKKVHSMSNPARKTPERIAELICGGGECICGYPCGHTNKPAAENLPPLLGVSTTCPLAHHNVQPDARPWNTMTHEERAERYITVDDCWRYCDSCPHSDHMMQRGKEVIHLKDFDTVCIDCPVWQEMDTLYEQQAEAALS